MKNMEIKKILIANLGSTSFKFKLFQTDLKVDPLLDKDALSEGEFENIGTERGGGYSIFSNGYQRNGSEVLKTHLEAFEKAVNVMTTTNALHSTSDIGAIVYKCVLAGPGKSEEIITDDTLSKLKQYAALAPAHNPAYIEMIEAMREKYPDLIQVACFETAFHSSIPLKRQVYGVPASWRTELGIRRYGYHGSSHAYIALKMAEYDPNAKKIISCHLGGSCSICAIDNGSSIASSMGTTPQSGLFNNNRVGDFDIFCLPALMEKYKNDLGKILKILSKQSGLLGISGISNDLRDVLSAEENENENAKLAIDAFVDNIVGYIGMFTAYLKGVNAISFTGGIGFKSPIIRKQICDELLFMGAEIDDARNKYGKEGLISKDNSKIKIYIWRANEEIILLKRGIKILKQNGYC